jgi:hypothetical protein
MALSALGALVWRVYCFASKRIVLACTCIVTILCARAYHLTLLIHRRRILPKLVVWNPLSAQTSLVAFRTKVSVASTAICGWLAIFSHTTFFQAFAFEETKSRYALSASNRRITRSIDASTVRRHIHTLIHYTLLCACAVLQEDALTAKKVVCVIINKALSALSACNVYGFTVGRFFLAIIVWVAVLSSCTGNSTGWIWEKVKVSFTLCTTIFRACSAVSWTINT